MLTPDMLAQTGSPIVSTVPPTVTVPTPALAQQCAELAERRRPRHRPGGPVARDEQRPPTVLCQLGRQPLLVRRAGVEEHNHIPSSPRIAEPLLRSSVSPIRTSLPASPPTVSSITPPSYSAMSRSTTIGVQQPWPHFRQNGVRPPPGDVSHPSPNVRLT